MSWCEKERVPIAIITHCGSEIVSGDERQVLEDLRRIAAEDGIEACIAYDGMQLTLMECS